MNNTFFENAIKLFDFDSNQKEDILNYSNNISDLIARQIENKKRVIFVGIGVISKITLGYVEDIELNFSIEKSSFISVEAGRKYKEHLNQWSTFGESEIVAVFDLEDLSITSDDVVIALSSRGKNKYIFGALKHANTLGAKTILISNNEVDKEYLESVDIFAKLEIVDYSIHGLSSFEATTFLKFFLDITLLNSMKKAGRIFNDELIYRDLNLPKWREWAVETLSKITKISPSESMEILKKSGYNFPLALICTIKNCSIDEGKDLIVKNKGNLNFLNN